MKRLITVIFIFLLGSLPTFAQCEGLPCGAIPWSIPSLPRLASPTPFPTVYATATTGSDPSPGDPTATIDASGIGAQQGNLEGFLSATPQIVLNQNGTPVAPNAPFLASNGSLVISYIKALTQADFGILSPLLGFLIFMFTFMLGVKITEVFIPFSAVIFKGIKTAFQIIADFLPF